MNKEEYAEYLKSEHWQHVREAALERARGACQLCGDDENTLNVHHNNYNRLEEEWDSDVIVLCSNCHAQFHSKLVEAEFEEKYASIREQYYNLFLGVTGALVVLESMDNPYRAVCTNSVIKVGVDAIIYQQEEMGLTEERYNLFVEAYK